MKKYTIDILPKAAQDIISIRESILRRYNDFYNANIVIDRIFNTINSLSTFPKRAQVRIRVNGYGIRFLKAGKYTISFYVDSNNHVKIYGVFHSRRDIIDIIKNRN